MYIVRGVEWIVAQRHHWSMFERLGRGVVREFASAVLVLLLDCIQFFYCLPTFLRIELDYSSSDYPLGVTLPGNAFRMDWISMN